jgi:GTPase SAR1 family protein
MLRALLHSLGQERFSTITANYYRGAQGVMLVYDVSSRESFEHVRKWFERAKQLGGEELIAILVGNKCDIGAELMDGKLQVMRKATL